MNKNIKNNEIFKPDSHITERIAEVSEDGTKQYLEGCTFNRCNLNNAIHVENPIRYENEYNYKNIKSVHNFIWVEQSKGSVLTKYLEIYEIILYKEGKYVTRMRYNHIHDKKEWTEKTFRNYANKLNKITNFKCFENKYFSIDAFMYDTNHEIRNIKEEEYYKSLDNEMGL